jgi:sulfonate transport system substrate-binding protein
MLEDAVRVARFLTDAKNHDEVVALAAKVSKQPAANLDYVFTKEDNYRDPNMLPNLDTFQRAIDIQRETGFLKNPVDAKKLADLSLVKEAAQRIK